MKGFRKGGVIRDITQHRVIEQLPAAEAAAASPSTSGRGDHAAAAGHAAHSEASAFYRSVVGESAVGAGWEGEGGGEARHSERTGQSRSGRPLGQAPGERGGGDAAPLPPGEGAVSVSAEEAAAPRPKHAIRESNVGYKLLCKAGWQEGQGLGAHGQGPVQPLAAGSNPGRRGLGSRPAPASGDQQQQQQQGQRLQGERQRQQGERQRVGRGGERQQQPEAMIGPRYDPVAAELARDKEEDLGTRIRRHKQVWQAEVDDAAGKAIQRYLSRALRDDGGGGDTTDVNPLLRRGRHKLSSSNPLL